MTAKGFSETDIGAVPVTKEFRDISNINRMKEKNGDFRYHNRLYGIQ